MQGKGGGGGDAGDAFREDAAPELVPGKRSLTETLGRPVSGHPGTPGQRSLTGELSGPGRVPPSIASALASALASAQGVPLPNADAWSRRVGADVRDARVVTGEGAAEAAAAVGARAFTVGNRVFFGAGYDPSSEGGALLDHELAHVVQQRGATAPTSPDQLAVVPRGDHREAEARSGAAPAEGTSELAIARDGEPDIDAGAYRQRFAREIGDGIVAYLAAHDLPTGSRFVVFPGPLTFGPAILGVNGAALEAKLDAWLGRDRVVQLVDQARPMGREQVTDGDKTWIEDKWAAGPTRWFPDVATELAGALYGLLRQSLDRIVPRYQRAAVATAIAAEEKVSQSLVDPPRPTAGDVIASHPIDVETIRALIDHARFDLGAYRLAYPGEKGAVGQLRQVAVTWLPPRNGTYWARVSPADATVEEVAATLYGTPLKSGELAVVAPPLFGFANATILQQAHRDALTAMGADIRSTGDVLAEAATGPLADEIAQNQGALTPGKAATKGAVLRTLDESLAIIPTIEQSGAAFGMGKNPAVASMAALTKRLTERRAKIAAATEEDTLKWSGQTEAQQEILTSIAFGFDREARRLADLTKMVTDASIKLGGFNLPPHVREAMNHVAMRYADCALISDAPQTAAAKLAEVEDEAGALPVTFLEGTLASIQRTLDDARAVKHGQAEHDSYDVPGMAAREQQLKARLTAVRAQIKTDPEGATKELKEIARLIEELQVETEMVGNMDQIDAAWQALDDGISFWWSSLLTQLKASDLKDRGDQLHKRWKDVFVAWKSGDPAKQAQAKQDYESLRADPALAKWLGEVQSTLKSAQIERLIGQLVALIAITVVTAGVGDLVVAGAAGWELSAGATAVVAGGAEAATFTLLSQIFLDSDHSFGHIVYEFGANWAMFGVMRRFQLFAEAAKLGKISAVGGNVLILAATTYAKADLDKYIHEGRHLTGDEVKTIALQGMAMAIAMHAIAPMTKPLFAELEGSAYAFASKLKANNRMQETLAVQAEALKGTRDFGQAQEYVAQERAWLEERLRILDEIEAAAKQESAPGAAQPKDGSIAAKIKMSAEDLAALRTDLQGKLAQLQQGTLPLATLEPKGPGLFTCPREHIAEVVRSLGEVQKTTTNPDTGVTTYEVKLPDNTVVKVMEKIEPAPDAKGAPLSDAQARLEVAKLHGISGSASLEAFEALCQAQPREMLAFLEALKSQPGLANRLLARFGRSTLTHFDSIGGDMVGIHGELELSAAKLASLGDADIVKLVEVCKNKGPGGAYEYFESSSTKDGKPGARLRFKSRLEGRANEVGAKLLESLGIDRSDPRAAIFDGMNDGDAIRLWDLFNERGFKDAAVRRQAAEWAFGKKPGTVRELVAELQFYDAEVTNRRARILADAQAELPKELARREATKGSPLTPEEIRNAIQDVTKAKLGKSFDREGPAWGKQATAKALDEMAQATAGADGKQTTVGAEAADAAWKMNLDAQQGPNAAGPKQIGIKTDAELPGYVKSIADTLGFGTGADGAYHAHKHASELSSKPSPEAEMATYLQAARDFIRTKNGVVRHNQNGSRSVVFEADGMRAIVSVSVDGNASIATFGKASN